MKSIFGTERSSPRRLSDEQKGVIVEMYIYQNQPARVVADALGEGWGQHDIYIFARKLQKANGLPHYFRGASERIDVELVLALREEGFASDSDIAEFYKSSPEYIRRKRRRVT